VTAASNGVVERDPVGRAISVLRWMIEGTEGALGVREIARGLDLTPSVAHRALANLEQHGFVVQKSSRKYEVGWEFLRIAQRAIARFSLGEVAQPILEELANESGETACFGVYDPLQKQLMFIASVESPHPLRYVIAMHSWMPLHSGASGLAILAFLPPEERREIVRALGLPAMTKSTIVDEEKLERACARIRRKGYAYTRGQRVAGAVGIAAPLLQSDSQVLGDVVLTIPEQRFSPRSEAALGKLVKDAAARISRAIGD
jgi:IclR family acetate operon transcriptional repressor